MDNIEDEETIILIYKMDENMSQIEDLTFSKTNTLKLSGEDKILDPFSTWPDMSKMSESVVSNILSPPIS